MQLTLIVPAVFVNRFELYWKQPTEQKLIFDFSVCLLACLFLPDYYLSRSGCQISITGHLIVLFV